MAQEKAEQQPSGPRALWTTHDKSIRPSLRDNPALLSIYQRYVREHIPDFGFETLATLPKAQRDPYLYMLKQMTGIQSVPMTTLGLAKGLEVPVGVARKICGSIEVLSAVSLMIDDIEDNDTKRRGQPTSWVKFGVEATKNSYDAVYGAVLKKLEVEFGPDIRAICEQDCERARVSLQEQKTFTFDSSLDEIMADWDVRQRFYIHYPFAAFAKIKGEDVASEKYQTAMEAMRLGMRVLQYANDVEDIVYKRSDIRNGLITAPLKMLYEKLGPDDQARLQKIMGKSEISKDDNGWLHDVIYETGVIRDYMSDIRKIIGTQRRLYNSLSPEQDANEFLLKPIENMYSYLDTSKHP